MEKLIEILEDIQPDADYETCTTLIDDGILDSFAILSIVGELEDEFDVSVTPADIIPENYFFMFCDNIFLSQIVRPVFGRMIHQKSGKAG